MRMIVEPAVIDGKMATCPSNQPNCRHKCRVYSI